MKKIYKGFSLIELLVVVAIIGILATLALPTYNIYHIQANLSAVIKYMGGLQDQVEVYYARNASFPNLSNLGVATSVISGGTSSNNTYPPNTFSDYFLQPNIMSLTISNSNWYGTCGQAEQMTVVASNVDNGIYTNSNTSPNVAFITFFTIQKNGVLESYCTYSYGTFTGTPLTGNYIPGCVNDPFDSTVTAFVNSC